jgi:hypothetical protein
MRYFRQNYIYVLVALLKLPVAAANVALVWNPDADPAVLGYHIYYGGASGAYNKKISIGVTTNVTIAGLMPGATYYFAASAYGAGGLESPLSAEVSCRVPTMVSTKNQAPTLNPIGNLTLRMNAGLQAVTLSGIGSGSAGENQTLIVQAASSNPGLIPRPLVNYTSPQATGTLTFQPATNQFGTAVITVTVNDGGSSDKIVTRKFTVTVTRAAAPATAGSRPVITCSLTNQAALIGQTRTFAVKATGKGTLKYQWKFKGTNLPATGSTLTLRMLNTNQSGVYSVTVADRNGSTNSAASLTVYATAAGTVAAAGVANGHCALTVPAVPGCRYIVQASTDLAHWTPVRTNVAPFNFEDPDAVHFQQRFYRAVYVP